MSKRILIICPHPVGVAPGQRLKYEQYFSAFQEAGYDVNVSAFMTDSFHSIVYKKGHFLGKVFWTLRGYCARIIDLFRLRNYNLVYVFLWVTPFGPPIFERLYRAFAKKLLYDIDDLVYSKHHKNSSNALISGLKGRNKPIYLMKVADHVITCTPHLDSFVRRYNQKTTDISSTINTDTYVSVNPYSNNTGRPIVLGWSGSITTAKYLHLLDTVLRELRKRRDFKLLVMGAPDFTIDGIDIETVPWSESAEIPTLQRIDIGLYPLPDEEWVLGKSGLKALQYMALGLPTVATAIGANFRVLEDGVSGFLVSSEAQWLERLEQLMDDPSLRKRLGEAARHRVESLYSIRANTPVYLKILDELTGRKN
jgi:L-malate glycosyltransferase